MKLKRAESAAVTIGQDRFPLVTLGNGPPLLFLHGAPGDHRTWERHQQLLAPRFRTIAYTQRWFGTAAWRSDGPPFGTATHASDLIAIIEALELAPVRLVAWSYAAHVALLALVHRHDLFHSAMIYEPGVPTYVDDADDLRDFALDANAVFGPIQGQLQGGQLTSAVRELIDASGGPGYFDAQDAALREVHLASATVLPLLMGRGAPPVHLSAADLRSIPVPVSVAWGSNTRSIFEVPSRAASALLSGRHREVAGRGHLWPEEDPAGFCQLVEELIG